MLHAALRGKLSHDFHDEDALTSVVFGLLRYLPPNVLGQWFQLARSVDGGVLPPLPLDRLVAVDWWPRYGDVLRGHGIVEPDALITWGTEQILVEAKLRSGKHQTTMALADGADEQLPSEGAADRVGVADQLARQWLSARAHLARIGESADRMRALLFVTAHSRLPREMLLESEAAIARANGVKPSLLWLSWAQLGTILRREMLDRTPHAPVVEDLMSYLDAADVLGFCGWLFQHLPNQDGAFWRYAGPHNLHYHTPQPPISPLWRYLGTRLDRYCDVDSIFRTLLVLPNAKGERRMSDLTENVGRLHAALKQVFKDLDRLATDFNRLLGESSAQFLPQLGYSYSTAYSLFLRADHAWLYTADASGTDEKKPEEGVTTEVTFASMYVRFEALREHRKLTNNGRPEVWFILGKQSDTKTSYLAKQINTFFNKDEMGYHSPQPTLGGPISRYHFDTWHASLIGYELGEIDSVDTLRTKVVDPLLAADPASTAPQ